MGNTKKGNAAVMSIAPGWMISGVVVEEDADTLTLENVSYLESVVNGYSTWSACETAKAIQACWPMPNGTIVRKTALIMYAPASMESVTALARRHSKDTIEKAR